MYAAGRGVPQDDAEAVTWFRRTADQGIADAQNNLGLAYASGWGVPQNDVTALVWLNLAGAQGDEEARRRRARLAERMPPDQRAEAERRAREWLNNGK